MSIFYEFYMIPGTRYEIRAHVCLGFVFSSFFVLFFFRFLLFTISGCFVSISSFYPSFYVVPWYLLLRTSYYIQVGAGPAKSHSFLHM